MKRLVLGSLALCIVLVLAPEAFAWRGGGGVYRGPAGGAAIRGPAGGVAVRGPGAQLQCAVRPAMSRSGVRQMSMAASIVARPTALRLG